jgi:hypothetical protein
MRFAFVGKLVNNPHGTSKDTEENKGLDKCIESNIRYYNKKKTYYLDVVIKVLKLNKKEREYFLQKTKEKPT